MRFPNGPTASASLPAHAPKSIVDALLGDGQAIRTERLSGGGNNRLYRVETADGPLVLKCYGASDRLEREFSCLSLLAAHREEAVPSPIAAASDERAALYSWIEGRPVGREAAERMIGDIAQMTAFLTRLTDPRLREKASGVQEAAEACLSLTSLTDQIAARFHRLRWEAPEPRHHLIDFLDGALRPVMNRAITRAESLYRDAGLAPGQPLAPRLRVLSPSDFGFHNALRRPDGRLAFLDFEYFGWDDPVKLTADLLWHPAFRLTPDEQAAWITGCADLFGGAPCFAGRLDAQRPLYGLRWCLILLNEFLPDRWERRQFAGATADWADAKASQLAKAENWLNAVTRQIDTPLSDFLSFAER